MAYPGLSKGDGGASPTLDSDALAWVLARSDSGDFVARHLGKRWLHVRDGRGSRFEGLLSFSQLDEVLGTYGVRHPGIRLVRADEDIPTSEYLWRDGMVDPSQVARLFSEGATVIFGALHDRHEGMQRLCVALTNQLCARTQTNIYLTPPDSQGFKPHWDTHDVYVLQVQGSKRWRMYGGGLELPLRDQKFDPEVHSPGELQEEFTLRAGEVLYVPRGVMHAAATTGETSLHITLGVMSYTWSDLLADGLSELVGRDAGWRSNVPFGFARAPDGLEALEDGLRERLARLGSQLDLEAVAAERQRAFQAAHRPRTRDPMRQAAEAASVRPQDYVRWRSGAVGRLECREGRAVIIGVQREVDFPGAAVPILEAVLGGGPLRAIDAASGLDWESCRVVLSALVREGLVVIESGDEP